MTPMRAHEERTIHTHMKIAGKRTEGTFPTVVVLCGSSKFAEEHMQAQMRESLKGHIVIPMGCYGHADVPAGAKEATADGDEDTEVKQMLDQLHFRKIDLADEILVVSDDSHYFGSSTKREIAYAHKTGKNVRFQWQEED